jgi:hypothetical protein
MGNQEIKCTYSWGIQNEEEDILFWSAFLPPLDPYYSSWMALVLEVQWPMVFTRQNLVTLLLRIYR